MSHILV